MLPKPTLAEAVHGLRERDEFKVIFDFVRDERERLFADLQDAETPSHVMKLAGRVEAINWVITILDSKPDL